MNWVPCEVNLGRMRCTEKASAGMFSAYTGTRVSPVTFKREPCWLLFCGSQRSSGFAEDPEAAVEKVIRERLLTALAALG